MAGPSRATGHRRRSGRLWRWADDVVQRFLLRSGTTKVWSWQKAERSTLARFVAPATVAAEIGPLDLIDGRTVHDVREEPAGPLSVAEASFDHIDRFEIRYDREGYTSNGEETQRIRTPIEMVEYRTGTCLDLTLLYAGHLMHHLVRPVVIVLEGHALLAVVVAQFPLTIQGAETDQQRLRQWVNDGALVPIECTALAVGEDVSADFATAVERGRRRVAETPLRFFIDPWELQTEGGLRPLRAQKVSPAKVGLLGSAGVGLAAIGAVALWPGPEVPRMPATDGQNIALFMLEPRGDATVQNGETVAEQLATTLRGSFQDAGELRSDTTTGWTVWGPNELDMDEPPPLDPERFEQVMRDRNIDIALFGVLDAIDGRRFPQISIWFRPSARGAREAGVTGGIVLAADDDGTTASLTRIAADLSAESDAWFELLQGLGQLHDATNRSDLLTIRETFDQAAESTSGDTRALANLLTGGTHLYIDATFNPDDEVARAANTELATRSLQAVLNDPSRTAAALRARAALALAQVELNLSGCNPEDPQPDGIERAEQLVVRSVTAMADGSSLQTGPTESELLFRRRVMEGRIAFCRWQSGLEGDGPESDSRSRADAVLTEAIDDYEARDEPEERDRVRFPVADAYGLRGQLTGTEDPEAALLDLVWARCLARPFTEEFWRAQEQRLTAANPGLAHEGGCRALGQE